MNKLIKSLSFTTVFLASPLLCMIGNQECYRHIYPSETLITDLLQRIKQNDFEGALTLYEKDASLRFFDLDDKTNETTFWNKLQACKSQNKKSNAYEKLLLETLKDQSADNNISKKIEIILKKAPELKTKTYNDDQDGTTYYASLAACKNLETLKLFFKGTKTIETFILLQAFRKALSAKQGDCCDWAINKITGDNQVGLKKILVLEFFNLIRGSDPIALDFFLIKYKKYVLMRKSEEFQMISAGFKQ